MALESQWYHTITRLNAEILHATYDFYRGRGIAPVLMPITVNSVSSPMGLGSDSLPVKVDLMGEPTYLADSMQFQLEFMLRHGLPGAYYVMPTFRGEDPDATHLNQFFHSEAEIPGGLDDVIELVEAYIRALCGALLTASVAARLSALTGDLSHLRDMAARDSFPRITFAEACEVVDPEYVSEPEPGVRTLARGGEHQLIERFGGAVWVTHMPALAVPFYQAGDDDGTARCADLLFGLGEVVGCGERHATKEATLRALDEHHVAPDKYDWYLHMKDAAPMRTAGFGLGLERFLAWVLQHDDVRDLHVMPRLKGVPTWM
ncbi:hypothetical protein A6A06_16165 [Streptomyces sp. CB02923]|nr:hypothetical protein A6A06_16165 [Streptomyces sp. CB02923]